MEVLDDLRNQIQRKGFIAVESDVADILSDFVMLRVDYLALLGSIHEKGPGKEHAKEALSDSNSDFESVPVRGYGSWGVTSDAVIFADMHYALANSNATNVCEMVDCQAAEERFVPKELVATMRNVWELFIRPL